MVNITYAVRCRISQLSIGSFLVVHEPSSEYGAPEVSEDSATEDHEDTADTTVTVSTLCRA